METLLGILPYIYFEEPVQLGNVTFLGYPDWQGRNHAPRTDSDRQCLQQLSSCFLTTRGLSTNKGAIKAMTYFLLSIQEGKETETLEDARKAITLLRYALLRPDTQALDSVEFTYVYAFALPSAGNDDYRLYRCWPNLSIEQETWVKPEHQKFPLPGWYVDLQLVHTSWLEDIEDIQHHFYTHSVMNEEANILLAMEWYNQSFQNYSIRDTTGYLVDVATAFETLFRLPRYRKAEAFINCVKQHLNLQDEPLVDKWCEQFYGEVRSETLHTGKPTYLLFRHPDAELPHLSFLWSAQLIFRECMSALAELPRHVANDRLIEYLIPNEVHLGLLRRAGSWEDIQKGSLLEEVSKLRQVPPTGKREDIIWLGRRLLTAYKGQLEKNKEQCLPTLDAILDTEDTDTELASKYHRFYKEFSPLYFGKPVSRRNLEQLQLMNAIYHFANFATWALLMPP